MTQGCPFILFEIWITSHRHASERKYCSRRLYSVFFPNNSDIPTTPWMSVHKCCKEETTIDPMKVLTEIDFDDEICALIILASLPNSWEAMKMTMSNFTGKEKLKQCKSPKKKNEDDSANAVTEEVHDALLLAVDNPLDDWVLDSGASFHTTPHREIIQNYTISDFGKVYLVDGSALDVVGLGDVRISLPNGSVWLLEKVRHIPDSRRNLISVGQLDDEGHAILFVVETQLRLMQIDTSLWHRKLGHMSEKGMKMLLTPKAEKLELVHIDLWRTSPIASLGGSRSDNGGEYIDGGFSEYCANGVVERMNKTLNERARSMRLHVGLPKTFWADAISTTAYLINRGPSAPMEFGLLEEVWSDKEVDFSTPVGEVRRFSRNIRPPQSYSPPECYDEALQDENSSKWELAMKDEMDSLLGNQTWELTKLSIGKKALHNKWVYKIKNEHDGSKRYKARLVVKGFQ
ncbi:hypothetical protein AAG906_040856 [Vitis piasezkii]